MSNVRPTPQGRRFFQWIPLDFSRKTVLDKTWRRMAALCLFLSVVPLAFAIPLGWVFALRVAAVCGFGAHRSYGMRWRLGLLMVDFVFLLWWMFGGYPQAPTELALAVFVLGVSFKAMELRTVGDGYMASAMCFLGPFLAVIQSLPLVIIIASTLSILLALVLRSGVACLESGQSARPPWARQHWSVIAGMLGMALPVALAMFWLLPRLPSPYFGLNKVGGGGVPETMEPGSMDKLMQDPSPALLVYFKGTPPPPQDIYWRTFVLSSFNGRTWFQVGLPLDAESKPVPVQGSPAYEYDLSMLPVAGSYVPFMDRALKFSGDRAFSSATLTFRSPDGPRIRQFHAQSAPDAVLDAGLLSSVVRRANLLLPDGYNPRTRQLAMKWRKQAGKSDAKVVELALQYFRQNMTYSYTPPLLGHHSVDELMFDTKEGFCEHFSSSFVFAMRAANIPARVVSGYQGGRPTANGGWEVRQLDAHAWAEVWMEKRGWVRVDPTFAVVRKRPAPPGEEEAGLAWDGEWMNWLHDKTGSWFSGFDQKKQKEMFSHWKSDSWVTWMLALGVGLVIMAWAFSALLLGWQRTRPPAEVVQWEKFLQQARLWTPLPPSATPRQISQALSQSLPRDKNWDKQVVARWEAWRYAGASDEHLARDLARARKGLRRPWGRRGKQ